MHGTDYKIWGYKFETLDFLLSFSPSYPVSSNSPPCHPCIEAISSLAYIHLRHWFLLCLLWSNILLGYCMYDISHRTFLISVAYSGSLYSYIAFHFRIWSIDWSIVLLTVVYKARLRHVYICYYTFCRIMTCFNKTAFSIVGRIFLLFFFASLFPLFPILFYFCCCTNADKVELVRILFLSKVNIVPKKKN